MIELKNDTLRFSFPEVHKDARMQISFQRTLRIPDDGEVHYLPPGLGDFPLRHVDDFARSVPPAWIEHGGVLLPMYQSEAMWIFFDSDVGYPFLVKVAAGKINAVTGESWLEGAHRDPQDYLVVPGQPWLDGFCVEKGVIRQFVAMPLGHGYTAEEQITGEAEHGGLQIAAFPMKAAEWEKIRKEGPVGLPLVCDMAVSAAGEMEMGLAPGGQMKQEIYDDPYDFDVWDLRHGSRCFVHIANSIAWGAITGASPPTLPPTAKQYTDAGLPWFNYYGGDLEALEAQSTLKGVKSVAVLSGEKGEVVLPENKSSGECVSSDSLRHA